VLAYSNVLVLSPHTDDSELGAGGLIARLVSSGARVTVMVFCNAVKSLNVKLLNNTADKNNILLTEFKEAANLQKVNTVILNYPVRNFDKHRQDILEAMCARRRDYDLVLTPCAFDVHQDHKVIFEETQRAFKNTTVLGYELPWNHVNFNSPLYIKLSKEHLAKKWAAVSCYKSQIEMNRAYFTREFIYGLASVRGVQIGSKYAEMYQFINGVSL